VILNKIEWVFFDFDGVIANSTEIMYKVYMEFLKKYGFHGDKNEFEKLNGPTLSQIVVYLKNKYKIHKSEEILLQEYQKKVEFVIMKKIKPMKGITKLLDFLKNQDYKLALVTSSSKKIVKPFLEKNNLTNYFDVLTYGDKVKESKPDPEIYNLCLNHIHVHKKMVLVLEDSENGCISASRAGLKYLKIKDKSIEGLISIFK